MGLIIAVHSKSGFWLNKLAKIEVFCLSHVQYAVHMKKRLLALMEEASEEQPSLCYSSRGIRWSSNILIGSIPLKKKSLFSLITLMFGLEQRGSSIYLLPLSPILPLLVLIYWLSNWTTANSISLITKTL